MKQIRLTNFIGTLTIMVMVLVLSALLAFAGFKAYKATIVANEKNHDLRTSLTYLSTKVRSLDSADTEFVVSKSRNLFSIKEDFEGEKLVTYIYYKDSYLWECVLSDGEEFNVNDGFRLIPADGFSVNSTDKALEFTIVKGDSSERLKVSLRSGGKIHEE